MFTAAAHEGRFGWYQCEAAIQSVNVQRPVSGRLNLAALRTLYDLLIAQSDSVGARIGRAVILAEAGDKPLARAELDARPTSRIKAHQPWWVAKARVATFAGDWAEAEHALTQAITLTDDPEVRRFLGVQLSALRC